MKNIFLVAFLLALTATSACNTMEGLGEDVQKGGENLEDAANTNR